jgi:hypothetical protein
MALEARVKPDYYLNTVIAFSGHEYFKDEWRPVPEHDEEAARTHEQLEVREVAKQAESLDMAEPALKADPKRRKARKVYDEDE